MRRLRMHEIIKEPHKHTRTQTHFKHKYIDLKEREREKKRPLSHWAYRLRIYQTESGTLWQVWLERWVDVFIRKCFCRELVWPVTWYFVECTTHCTHQWKRENLLFNVKGRTHEQKHLSKSNASVYKDLVVFTFPDHSRPTKNLMQLHYWFS